MSHTPLRHTFALLSLLVLVLGPVGCGEGALDDTVPEVEPRPVEALQLGALAERAYAGTEVSSNADVLLDEIGPRISALPSGERAQDFVEERLQAYGVENVRQEPFELLAWDRRSAELQVLEPAALGDATFNILSLGHVGSYDIEAPLLDAGYGTAEEIEALGDEVEGTIVLVDVGSPEGYGRGVHRTEKVTLATRAGAVGFIQVNNREGPLVPVGVATLGDEPTEIPAAAVDLESGTRLLEALAEGPVEVRLVLDNWMERSTAANVLGDIPGATDEVILVGAHLDSWDLAQGAVDNGSGSLAVLDLARALAEHVEATGETPLRTLRFAFWMGEELGLYGSHAHVDAMMRQELTDRYAAVLNLDVVGAPVGLGAMGRPEAEDFMARVRAPLVEAGFELDETHSTGGGIYSDHQPFLLQGVPIVVVRSRQLPEAAGVSHTTADTREVIDEDGISRTAAVSAALLWALANEPELPVITWEEDEIGVKLEELGVRDPLERAGDWRWD
jgi:carboxypeptidase Q